MTHLLKNCRQIKVKLLPVTDTKPHRLKMWEQKRHSEQATESIVFRFDYDKDNIVEQAADILVKNGFHLVCKASEDDYSVILCDDFGDKFKKISELKT